MKNLLAFTRGGTATAEESHMVEKIRALSERYANGETCDLLTVLVAYAKISGAPRKLSRILDMTPVEYAKALCAAGSRLKSDREFSSLFHFIRSAAEESKLTVPRFPAAPPYQ